MNLIKSWQRFEQQIYEGQAGGREFEPHLCLSIAFAIDTLTFCYKGFMLRIVKWFAGGS